MYYNLLINYKLILKPGHPWVECSRYKRFYIDNPTRVQIIESLKQKALRLAQ